MEDTEYLEKYMENLAKKVHDVKTKSMLIDELNIIKAKNKDVNKNNK